MIILKMCSRGLLKVTKCQVWLKNVSILWLVVVKNLESFIFGFMDLEHYLVNSLSFGQNSESLLQQSRDLSIDSRYVRPFVIFQIFFEFFVPFRKKSFDNFILTKEVAAAYKIRSSFDLYCIASDVFFKDILFSNASRLDWDFSFLRFLINKLSSFVSRNNNKSFWYNFSPSFIAAYSDYKRVTNCSNSL